MENIVLIPIMIFVFAFGFFVAELPGRTPEEQRRGEKAHVQEKRSGKHAGRHN